MSSLVSRESDSSDRQFYSRKEKSLGLLCSNFLKLYSCEGVDAIGLDDAASKLRVERRRIYDVVNILESVGVVARRQKNQYSWKGFAAIPRALKELKEEGLKENFKALDFYNSSQALSDKEDSFGSASGVLIEGQNNSSTASKADNKREKSLWLLSQNFAKFFLCSDLDVITLDHAARALLGEGYGSTAMRTKVRRLYDITNVFSSMHLIEKIPHPDSRKPAIRWLGCGAKATYGLASSFNLNDTRNRMFGTEITNYNLKRSSEDVNENSLVDSTQNDTKDKYLLKNSKQRLKHSSKDFVFGPFTPVGRPCDGDSGEKHTRRCPDWESVASTYVPRYCNQAMGKLLGHYVDAWKSWHVETHKKKRHNKDLEAPLCI